MKITFKSLCAINKKRVKNALKGTGLNLKQVDILMFDNERLALKLKSNGNIAVLN